MHDYTDVNPSELNGAYSTYMHKAGKLAVGRNFPKLPELGLMRTEVTRFMDDIKLSAMLKTRPACKELQNDLSMLGE